MDGKGVWMMVNGGLQAGAKLGHSSGRVRIIFELHRARTRQDELPDFDDGTMVFVHFLTLRHGTQFMIELKLLLLVHISLLASANQPLSKCTFVHVAALKRSSSLSPVHQQIKSSTSSVSAELVLRLELALCRSEEGG